MSDDRSNVNTTSKYPKTSAIVEPFLLSFLSLYIVEASFSHTNAIQVKQRNRLNMKSVVAYN